jgi:hypothetical protein
MSLNLLPKCKFDLFRESRVLEKTPQRLRAKHLGQYFNPRRFWDFGNFILLISQCKTREMSNTRREDQWSSTSIEINNSSHIVSFFDDFLSHQHTHNTCKFSIAEKGRSDSSYPTTGSMALYLFHTFGFDNFSTTPFSRISQIVEKEIC